jgi:hypothetical protein
MRKAGISLGPRDCFRQAEQANSQADTLAGTGGGGRRGQYPEVAAYFLVRQHARVDQMFRASDIGCFIRSQELRYSGNLMRIGDAAERDLPQRITTAFVGRLDHPINGKQSAQVLIRGQSQAMIPWAVLQPGWSASVDQGQFAGACPLRTPDCLFYMTNPLAARNQTLQNGHKLV